MTPLMKFHQLKEKVIHLQLETMTTLLGRIGNPQNDYRTVHVGGTNGKGSVAALVASMLGEGGWTVGLYTSPHLVDQRERIRIDGRMIDGRAFTACGTVLERHMPADTTYFEFMTAAAFLHFSREKVDMAVIEVGLGGRLDATNVLSPEVTVITNISREHESFLGGRLVDIAREKAGILKGGGDLVTGVSQEKVRSYLEKTCNEKGSRFHRLGRDFQVRSSAPGKFTYRGLERTIGGLSLPLAGRHQRRNAALALCTVEILDKKGFPVDEEAVRRGLREVSWPGRLEILRRHPTVVVDGAHNPAAVSSLVRALRQEFQYDRLGFVFGVLGDKDFRTMVKHIQSVADWIIFTRPGNERALDPEVLRRLIRGEDMPARVIEDPGEACREALKGASPGDLVCIAGSLYLVGDAYRIFSGRRE